MTKEKDDSRKLETRVALPPESSRISGTPRRISLRLTGQVQGVGMRPFVRNQAKRFGLSGFVRNDSGGVYIEAQGPPSDVEQFLQVVARRPPALAEFDSCDVTDISCRDEPSFRIEGSAIEGDIATRVAPDIAPCEDCLRELRDPSDRRYGYPFTNCTNCGPRFTIIEHLPYDRAHTTMNTFAMCEQCRAEYDDPDDRRYHAQPNACPVCGPTLSYRPAARIQHARDTVHDMIRGPDALQRCLDGLRTGEIMAVKGVGGFHLMCDARRGDVVAELRRRKSRVAKPFAVLVADVEQARGFASVSDAERRWLESPARPIVLLEKRTSPENDWLEQVAPGISCVGVMLPDAPLHELIANKLSPLVCTSANVSEEPIARANREAVERLEQLADGFLCHDREIRIACDDSVLRIVDGDPLPIRRSRGYAPTPISLPGDGPAILAVGGELKATCCLAKGGFAYVSSHVGDVSSVETLDALAAQADHLAELYRVKPDAVAADLHPDYLSSQWARRFAECEGIPFVPVQHHHAHAASLLVERDRACEDGILVCCFDGTGYGTDGAIWGGEFFLTAGMTFERVARLEYFDLPGGDASIQRPYRTALALLQHSGVSWDETLPCVRGCPAQECQILAKQLERRAMTSPTSSMGRLFDAVASLLDLRQRVSYEAQAAMELETLAGSAIVEETASQYRFRLQMGDPCVIECGDLIGAICRDVVAGRDRAWIAAHFHVAVAEMITAVATWAAAAHGCQTVGLTGGVFQNALLMRTSRRQLMDFGLEVLNHTRVPPNDGGLALGQVELARRQALLWNN